MGLRSLLKKVFRNERFKASSEAYDLWSAYYDSQPGNLMLDLDEAVFAELVRDISLEDDHIIDVGCGTGRHWLKILSKKPASLIGFDSSPGMIARLKEKFPNASARVSHDHQLDGITAESIDLLISTLTIAHMEDLAGYFSEWARVLRPGGRILLTDYHPSALQSGAKRTFKHGEETIAIKNFVHPISLVRVLARQRGLFEERFLEKFIDDNVKHYYESQNALHLYETFYSRPIIFGMLLKKRNAVS